MSIVNRCYSCGCQIVDEKAPGEYIPTPLCGWIHPAGCQRRLVRQFRRVREASHVLLCRPIDDRDELAREYRDKAARLKELVRTRLWDDEARFFKTLPRSPYELILPKHSLDGYNHSSYCDLIITPWKKGTGTEPAAFFGRCGICGGSEPVPIFHSTFRV